MQLAICVDFATMLAARIGAGQSQMPPVEDFWVERIQEISGIHMRN